MPLDPKARELLNARATVLPKTGTVSAQQMRALHRELLAKAPPGPPVHAVENLTIAGQGDDIPVRVYRPSATPKALIVYFHGGGWTVGSLDGWDTALRKLALTTACAVASVDYRLAPEARFPAAVDDARSAVVWAAANLEKLAGGTVPLFVAGDSAGANLSTVICQWARDHDGPVIAGQILLYPSTDGNIDSDYMKRFIPPSLTVEEVAWYFDQYIPNRADRSDPRFAPLHAKQLGNVPPALVLTVDEDLMCEEGEIYGQRLQEAGVSVKIKRFMGTFHGFFTADRGLLPHSGEAMADIAEFIDGVLGGKAA
ncbi:MAG: alpha/beta hydrolase [Janthinobacterium lividum]